MKKPILFFSLLLSPLVAGFPITTYGQVSAEELPGNTVWYLHADIAEIRSSEAGSPIYDWIDDEIIEEISDEMDVPIGDEVDSVTAFANVDAGLVVVVEGPLSEEFRDELMRSVREEVDVSDLTYDRKTYYFVDNDNHEDDNDEDDNEKNRDARHRDSKIVLEDPAYFSFAVDNKLIVTSHEGQMKALLDSGGRIAGSGAVDGAMFVLSADKAFVQAGLKPDGLIDADGDDWNSNIIRHTEEASLLLSDKDGQVAIDAQLRSTDPKMAQSIGGIVNGLISLQSFNTELGPEIQSLIQNTRVVVDENVLSISVVMDPEFILDIVD